MRILVIDDSPIDRKHFSQALTALENAEVLGLESLEDNLQRIAEYNPELVVLDDRLSPILAAEDSLNTIGKHFPNIPVLVMSGDIGSSRRAELIRRGAFNCMAKDEMDPAAMDLIVAMAELRSSVFKASAHPVECETDGLAHRTGAKIEAIDETNPL